MENPLSRRDRRLAARVSEPVEGSRPTAPPLMPSTRFRPAAFLTSAGLALGTLLFSAFGCQILSGISDLEATGGKDAVSTGASTTGTTSSTMTTGAMMTTGSGCMMPGMPVMGGCTPPFCHEPGVSVGTAVECLVNCEAQVAAGTCTGMATGGMAAMPPMYCTGGPSMLLDTNIAPMHVSCTDFHCDQKTFTCHQNASAPGEPFYPCILDCANGACSNQTIFDCTQTEGECVVRCNGPGSCSGLTVKCGAAPCRIECMGGEKPMSVMPFGACQPMLNSCPL